MRGSTRDNEWLSTLIINYNWLGSLLALGAIIVISKVGNWLAFKVPALEQMREINRSKDKEKWAIEKYPPIVRASQRVGLLCNITFFVLILPFCITLQSQPLWEILLDIFIILMF